MQKCLKHIHAAIFFAYIFALSQSPRDSKNHPRAPRRGLDPAVEDYRSATQNQFASLRDSEVNIDAVTWPVIPGCCGCSVRLNDARVERGGDGMNIHHAPGNPRGLDRE